jgi:hypothetical protein
MREAAIFGADRRKLAEAGKMGEILKVTSCSQPVLGGWLKCRFSSPYPRRHQSYPTSFRKRIQNFNNRKKE